MNNDKEFLKNLKAGDPVFCNGVLTKVHHITPTGIIVVDGIKYDPKSGRSKGTDVWSHSYLSEATKEKIEKYKNNQFVRCVIARICSLTLSEITYEQAKEIAKIMNWEM